MIKQFDPHDVLGVAGWVSKASGGNRYMRLLAFMPLGPRRVLFAYSCKEADPELEVEIESEGGKVIGYYRPPVEPMHLMADILDAWQEEA